MCNDRPTILPREVPKFNERGCTRYVVIATNALASEREARSPRRLPARVTSYSSDVEIPVAVGRINDEVAGLTQDLIPLGDTVVDRVGPCAALGHG